MTPTTEEVRKAAGRLGAVAEFEALVLRQLNWTVNQTSVEPGAEMSPKTTFNIAHGRSASLLRFQINSVVTGKVPAGELFRMASTHEGFFRVPEGDPTTEEELGAFGNVSVFFMVFPYIRELLHRLTGDAGLPQLLLKPLRIPFSPADGEPSPDLKMALEPGSPTDGP